MAVTSVMKPTIRIEQGKVIFLSTDEGRKHFPLVSNFINGSDLFGCNGAFTIVSPSGGL